MNTVTQSPEDAVRLLQSMLRIRRVEERIAREYAKGGMRCPVHLSIGQEAAAVGACAPLTAQDPIFTTHRCHGHYLAKGGDLRAMLAELHGRAFGCCGGRGGSMHLFDDAAGVVASVPIVASNIPMAVGAALAAKQRDERKVAVAFLGDAALEEGVCHESFNFAALHTLPVVFFVENNLYSVYTRIDERQPGTDLARFARAHNLPALAADGNDVLAVLAVMQEAVARARGGGGATVVTVETYRMLEHCGPACDDQLGYRPQGELQAWAERCPVEVFARKLTARGELDELARERMEAIIAQELEHAFEAVQAMPFPDPETAGDHVFATDLIEAVQ